MVIKKVPAKDLKRGDIILYKVKEQLVCHRFVKKINSQNGYLLYAQSDASPNLHETINEIMLIGKVSGILRKGRIINFTGRRHCLINRIILEFGPFLKIGIKLGKGPLIQARSLFRRLISGFQNRDRHKNY